MIAKGFQRLDAQDREIRQLGCKNRMIPACEEHLRAPGIKGCTVYTCTVLYTACLEIQ